MNVHVVIDHASIFAGGRTQNAPDVLKQPPGKLDRGRQEKIRQPGAIKSLAN
jgi:hypothetical protein